MIRFCLVIVVFYITSCESSHLKSRMKYRAKDVSADNIYTKKFIVSSSAATWAAAKTACAGLGGQLASLTSYAEVMKAAMLIDADENYWIGGQCPACTKTDVHEEKWEWLSKEKIPLSNLYWKTYDGEKMPHDSDGDAKFLSLLKKGTSPQFVNWYGGQSNKYICQKMLSIASKVLKYKTIDDEKKQNVH